MSDDRPHIYASEVPTFQQLGADITTLLAASGGAYAIVHAGHDSVTRLVEFGTFTEWTIPEVIARNASRYSGGFYAHCYTVKLADERDLTGALLRLTAEIERRGRPLHRGIHVAMNETGVAIAQAFGQLPTSATAEYRRAWLAAMDDFRSVRDRFFLLLNWPAPGEDTRGRPDAAGMPVE